MALPAILATIGAKMVGDGGAKLVVGVAEAIDTLVETEEERKAADLLLIKMQMEPAKWQAEINKIEAGNRSLFVAGWRPFIGWICGISLAWSWVLAPFAKMFFEVFGITVALPVLDTTMTISLVGMMLGMGGLRSYEKAIGASK